MIRLAARWIQGTMAGAALVAAPAAADLRYRTHPLGHAGVEAPPQSQASCLAVAADGTCIVGSAGHAGAPVVVMYRDGTVLRRCDPLPGAGFGGGTAVAVSDHHVFLAVTMTGDQQNGAAAAPPDTPPTPDTPPAADSHPHPGTIWHGIWRWALDGRPAPMPEGRGPGGALRLVHAATSAPSPAGPAPACLITGLWAHDGELFVSDAGADRVRVLDASTMAETRVIRTSSPGSLCVLGGRLFVVERGAVVTTYALDGKPTGQVLDEGDSFLPGAIAATPDGRLMVADRGPSEQIHLFNMSGVPTRVRTLGDERGQYALPAPGEAGPRRLAALTGVGTDAAGNYYLAMNPPPGGCILRSFGADRQSLRWQWLALAIEHGADADPRSHGLDVYTSEGRHALDLTKPPGQSWRWVAQTVDPRRLPHDPRLTWTAGGTTTFRELQEEKFLFHRGADGTALAVSRLEAQRATPVLALRTSASTPALSQFPHQPPTGPWIWRDADGNGQPGSDEFSATDTARFASHPVDAAGGLWRIGEDGGIHHWRCLGVDAAGLPTYADTPTLSRPAPPGVQFRLDLHFDATSDSLYLCSLEPSEKGQPPAAMLRRFNSWSQSPDPTPQWETRIPLNATTHVPSVTAAGSLVFVRTPAHSEVHVFRASNGHMLGTLLPDLNLRAIPASQATTGSDASRTGATGSGSNRSFATGHASPALRAHRRPDGSYLVFIQDPFSPRALVHHLDDPETDH